MALNLMGYIVIPLFIVLTTTAVYCSRVNREASGNLQFCSIAVLQAVDVDSFELGVQKRYSRNVSRISKIGNFLRLWVHVIDSSMIQQIFPTACPMCARSAKSVDGVSSRCEWLALVSPRTYR